MPRGDPMLISRESKQQRAAKARAVYEDRGWRYRDQHESIVYYRTGGRRGLGKEDLMENRDGKVVSRKRHELGKRLYRENEEAMRANQF